MNSNVFQELLNKVTKGSHNQSTILCLDPGHTTGLCVFFQGNLTKWSQSKTITETGGTITFNFKNIEDLFSCKPQLIICESFLLYSYKAKNLSWSEIPTLQLIGIIRYLANQKNIPIVFQTAQQAKNFITDEKLLSWGFYIEEMKHSRDAIRHGCYYLLTNKV